MLLDCFCLFNELELLDLRLHELNDLVDRFVICEATRTHSGKPKPLYYDENKSLFKEFEHKIEHIIVDDMPDPVPNRWIPEAYQRDQIMRGLGRINGSDVVMISDVDEIPDKKIIVSWSNLYPVFTFKMPTYFYYLNTWTGAYDICTIVARGSEVRMPGPHSSLRSRRHYFPAATGGWHFGWLGGEHRVTEKIESFGHAEFDTPKYKERIQDSIDNLEVFFQPSMKFKAVPVDATFPKYLQDNQARFADFIRNPE